MSYFRKLLTIGAVLVATTAMSFALKAEYRFEKCDGSATLENHVSNTLHGSLSGDANVSLGDGKITNALKLLGDGMMSVEHSSDLDLVENLTITFWVKPKENKRQALIVRGGGSGADRKFGSNAEYSLVLWEDGKFKYKHNQVADTFSQSAIALNQWTHIALVRDNGIKNIKIYINGVLDANRSYTSDPVSSGSEKLIIGSGDFYSASMKNFKGKLDEIKIYNLVLTQADITTLYDGENGGVHSTGDCQPAPEAVNDSKDLPFAGTVSVDILANDRANDSATCSVDATTIQFLALAGATLSDNNKTLTVPNEGVWSVDNSGTVTFVSENAFTGNPTVVSYIVSDSCGRLSNEATISLSRVAPPPVVVVPTPPISSSPSAPAIGGTPIITTPTVENNFTIGDRVWYDTNENGIQDSGELGVANVTVVLYGTDGSVIKRTTTNASGIYRFDNLSAGSYTIGFSRLPANYIFTTQNMGSSDAKDSDADSSGRTALFTIGNVENDLIYDAGIVSNAVATGGTPCDENSSVEEDCNCDPYKSSIPSISRVGMVFMLVLMGLLGAFFLRREALS